MQFLVRSSGTHTNNFRAWSEEDEAKLVEVRVEHEPPARLRGDEPLP